MQMVKRTPWKCKTDETEIKRCEVPAIAQPPWDQLMRGAERSFVTVGLSWTLAKGFLQEEKTRHRFNRKDVRKCMACADKGQWKGHTDDKTSPNCVFTRN